MAGIGLVLERGWENGLIGLILETLDLEEGTHIRPSWDWYADFVLVTLCSLVSLDWEP